MTTCAECLTALSTMRLSEIGRGSPIEQHYSTCENCSRVAADLQYAEHKLAPALSELGSAMPPSVVAEEAITGAEKVRRKNTAKWFRRALAAVAGVILSTYIMDNRNAAPKSDLVTQMVIPKCTNPDDAMAIVTPFLNSKGSAVYKGVNAKFITIRGVHREVETAISRLDEYESKFCTLPEPGQPVIPSAGK